MPPVFGPASPSSARLKSCAGCSGTTVTPSVTANSDTSGPLRYSSITTRSPAAWAIASSRSDVTTTPLPAASPSCLTTYGGGSVARTSAASSPSHTQCPAVGTPAAVITSLANALLPSSWAAAAEGPKTASPQERQASAAPATSGTSGPMTTRSAPHSDPSLATASGSETSSGRVSATVAVPALPGAQAKA